MRPRARKRMDEALTHANMTNGGTVSRATGACGRAFRGGNAE